MVFVIHARWFIFFLGHAFLGGWLPLHAGSAEAVFALVDARLELMPAVAQYKAAHRLPIEDQAREAVVLARALEAAETVRLEPASVKAFFTAQIAAAKAIQYRERAALLFAGNARTVVPDLTTEIRPRLLEIGEAFLTQLARHLRDHGRLTETDRAVFTAVVSHPRLHTAEADALFDALQQVRLVAESGG